MEEDLRIDVGDHIEFNSDPDDTDDPQSHNYSGTVTNRPIDTNEISIQLKSDNNMHTYFIDEIHITNVVNKDKKIQASNYESKEKMQIKQNNDLQDKQPIFIEHIISSNQSTFNTETQKQQLITNIKSLLNIENTEHSEQSTVHEHSWSTDANLQADSDSDNYIEELYTTIPYINAISKPADKKNGKSIQENGHLKILDKLYKKGAWFNDKKLKKDYESINPNIISSLSLTDLNDNVFRNQYEYAKLTHSTHWLIPNLFLVGEDPSGFVDCLVEDNFTTFVSLHEWKHSSYKDEIKMVCKHMGSIELIAFTIEDFETVDDKRTIGFIELLIQKILTIKKGKKIYCHCFGGHGRTGLISSLLLQVIYGMNSEISLKFINEIHALRHPYCGPDRMPESDEQLKQIDRLQNKMIQTREKYAVKKTN